MADLLSTGIAGIRTYQRALATVSNNITNVNTEGYSRQRLEITEGTSSLEGRMYIGSGPGATQVKRLYDGFLATSLNTNTAQLAQQESLYSYAEQLENVMADNRLGLVSALDGFFAAAQEVSLSPTATAPRQVLLNEAEATASRFRQLAGQLQQIEEVSWADMEAKVEEVNILATELAELNGSLAKHSSLDKQPPELLDHRDQLLLELSKLTRVAVVEKSNGVVDVHLGESGSGDLLVEGLQTNVLGLQRSEQQPERVDFVLSPYTHPKITANIQAGALAGINDFRQQALLMTRDDLDVMAQVFVNQVNQLQSEGIDARGAFGEPMFSLENVFEVEAALNQGDARIQIGVDSEQAVMQVDFELRYSAEKEQWQLTNQMTNASVTGLKQLSLNGLVVDIQGQAEGGDRYILRPSKRPAQAMELLMQDGAGIAAGKAVSVEVGENNSSGAGIILEGFNAASPPAADPALATRIRNNPAAVAASQVVSSDRLVLVIPAGTEDPQLFFASTQESDQVQLQVFTREGRHLAGEALTPTQQQSLLSQDNGFSAGAVYLDAYLNQTGDAGYRDKDFASVSPDERGHFGLQGSLNEDLLVFVTGSGTAALSGRWGGVVDEDPRQALRQDIDIRFDDTGRHYELIDRATQTSLAEADYRHGDSLSVNGWTLSLTAPPAANEVYRLKGNFTHNGDNRNLLDLVALQHDRSLFGDKGSFTEVYTGIVGDLGSIVVQTDISRAAQQVLTEQARERKEAVSGVNLDEEAAELLRYQQAYQAAAQVISTANKLFDSILAIR